MIDTSANTHSQLDSYQNHGYNYAAILLDDGSELVITDAMLEDSLNDPAMIELSQFLPNFIPSSVAH